MGRKLITILAILAIVVAAMQKTSLAFMSPDAADFVWGLAGGLSLGAIVAWIATGTGRLGS
jgi:hypothetical protein